MSAEFIAVDGELKGFILSLGEGEEWSIGRDPGQVDLVIEDPEVARKHLVCRKTPEGYVIENISDENPILVNGEPLSGPRLLMEEDRVLIGGTTYQFYPETESGDFLAEPEIPYEEEGHPEEEIPPEPLEDELHKEENLLEEEEEELSDEIFYSPFEEPEEERAEEESDEKEEFSEEEMIYTPFEEEKLEEEYPHDEIFEEIENPEETLDLRPVSRFLIKVISGPNTGAEFALDVDRQYILGTDSTTCDLIFNDLSVSREHARLLINEEGEVIIEDLESRNGVVIDQQRISGPTHLFPNSVVGLGTSAFLLIDREAPSETIVAPVFEAPPKEIAEEKEEIEEEEEKVAAAVPKKPSRPLIATGTLILSLIIASLAVLVGFGLYSLLQTKEVVKEKQDYLTEIQHIIKDFPGVRFTYNPSSRKLFLVGHVETAVQLNELLYRLRGLTFLNGIENNIVNDEAVWQEMNILLSKIPDFKGISMHSPQPGTFVISGYLKSEKQAADLIDYLNVNFNYLNLLQNRVVVEQEITDEITANLIQNGFGAVVPAFSAGDLVLTGYVSSTSTYEFQQLVSSFQEIPGVRSIKNFVVAVSPEQGVIDLNKRFPEKYRVTGFSKHGDVNINVVINGRILTRGDQIDGMTITSIQPHTIFLEKDGLKYKIEYNK